MMRGEPAADEIERLVVERQRAGLCRRRRHVGEIAG